MTNTPKIAVLAAMTIGLLGCEKQVQAPAAKVSTASTDARSGMAPSAGAKMGKAPGTGTAIGAAAGKITLDHGAIPAVGWPAMNMGFSVKPELLNGIAVGDRIAFEVTVKGNTGEVTAISRQ